MVSTDAGRQIDCSEEQDTNAASSREEIWQSGSNVKLDSLKQELKHNTEIVSINEGMQMD
jgi:hypothetical protein